ncbi:MAG: SpoIIE family protein phosphatase [Candidatus Krumholzibacteriia bacterium]
MRLSLRRHRPPRGVVVPAGPAEGRRVPSALNEPVWRLAIGAACGCGLAFLLARVAGPGHAAGAWLVAVPALAAWLAAVRLLLLDTRWRRFWTFWLAGTALFVPLLGSRGQGWQASVVLAAVFLFLRRYRPYRHLTSRRRAWLFPVALLAVICTTAGWDFRPTEQLGPFHALGQSALRYALGSLLIFWLLTASHLVFGMRLHFLRLRPKLATSAVFIAVVPLLLVILLWLVILLSVLGAARAGVGRDLLRDWVELAARDPAAGRALLPVTFTAREDAPPPATAPAWLPELWRALRAPARVPAASTGAEAPRDTVATAPASPADRGMVFTIGGESTRIGGIGQSWAPVDSSLFLRTASELWAVNLRREGVPPVWTVTGQCVDAGVLDHLSAVIGVRVDLYSDRGRGVDAPDSLGGRVTPADSVRTAFVLRGTRAASAAADSAAGFWRRPLKFGAAILDVIRLSPAGLDRGSLMLRVEATPLGLVREFWSSGNEFNKVIVIALVTLAILLLLIEAFAVFLGVRIATGITSAVATLHQGTVRLARGDLDTRIEVPNEDEFGDLADSFNEMTEAVKVGREQAIARERLERELRTAREIQERLLPHAMPDLPGWEITGVSVPSLQVGGDYFDFLALPDGRLGLAIADVSGKGIPAALLMANLQALLQGQVIHLAEVSDVVAHMNDLLTRSTDVGRFATFFYGALDSATGAFTATNAGHNPPLLLRADGRLEELKAGGLLIGMLEGQTYRQQTVTLEPGDLLVMFTDGITEAEGPPLPATAADPADGAPRARRGDATWDGREPAADDADDEDDDDDEEEEEEDRINLFGDDRLHAVLRATAGQGAGEIRAAILDAVARHAAGVPPSDDVTLVVVKRLG